ncbi:MAG: GalNAc(5)-diNAcBac-PP-undecaprenol beta-1,3-glucosyltransferase [Candidatus Accumulibacter regalis]|uniref:GalNAc(5)-diNAcBac-PP-undecaprenol beta-1,3-glucosyltransferase n=1 Tax=Accumulibacter regalis TaxID=522306 RepID=A0A011R8V4_ACCRE|nr:glycosyltransferase family A protein [Accumulibacter sp.]EXI87569.1 MAG: GalNAc(5)-diNAcBac-PP-undecaprenol beta-1,3-glucosyltransferase [Candidatus Accumulibacter regalis]HRE69597.1 glycosyltransferase family A protein [Accumulibacter sp.]
MPKSALTPTSATPTDHLSARGQPSLRVSCIIPTHNRRERLSAALASVTAQTTPVDEIVVIDDGSTDGTFEMLQAWREEVGQIHFAVLRQNNRGPAAARNAGMRVASGDLIAFLDDDDVWHAGKMARQLAVFTDHPNLALLACSSDTLSLPGRPGLRFVDDRDLLIRNRFLTPCVVVRRDIVVQCGGFPEGMRHCEDYALWLRIAARHNCAFLNETLVSCGKGKPAFGHSGLSADLAALYAGEREALRRWRKECDAGLPAFTLAQLLAGIRHLRRRAVSTWHKSR